MKQPRTIRCPRCDRKFASQQALAEHARSTHDNPAWKLRIAPERPDMSPPAITAREVLDLRCPRCGGSPQKKSTRFGLRADCCGLRSWGGKPLVDDATHKARNAAHAAFDPFWQTGRMSRGEAYRRLQQAMSMTPDQCHIALMNERQARRVVEVIAAGCMLQDEAAAA